jgi:hypothetical protein
MQFQIQVGALHRLSPNALRFRALKFSVFDLSLDLADQVE